MYCLEYQETDREKNTKTEMESCIDGKSIFKAHKPHRRAESFVSSSLQSSPGFKRIKGKRNRGTSRKWRRRISTPGSKRNTISTQYGFTAGAYRPRTGCTQPARIRSAKAEHRASIVQEAQLNRCVREPASCRWCRFAVGCVSCNVILSRQTIRVVSCLYRARTKAFLLANEISALR